MMRDEDFDLDAYARRIGHDCRREGLDAAALTRVQRAHRRAIAFENLDIPLGRGVSLDRGDVFDKLVMRRRGGYCFEQNQLLGRALAAIGFSVRPLLGRVWLTRPVEPPPRTHMLLEVAVDGTAWIADAGFGAAWTPPMPLAPGEHAHNPDGSHVRLRRHDVHGWWLERDTADGPSPMYSFTTDAVEQADIEQANHWTATHPTSRFVRLAVASRLGDDGLVSLVGRELARFSPAGTQRRPIADARDWADVVATQMGLSLDDAEVAALWDFSDRV